MNYPLISEYVEAIKLAEENLDQLSHLRPVLNGDGRPVMSSGNFAVVFKMRDGHNGKFYALKCFTREQEGRKKAYQQIANELKGISSPYLVSIRYLANELFVNSKNNSDTEFSVVVMDWVSGQTLDNYIKKVRNNQDEMNHLTSEFFKLSEWLLKQPFAHGDLKPDNILVKEDGSLVLVDYDGMYVPTMKGQSAREIGSPNFRLPNREINTFDRNIDDFPITTISLALRAITLKPDLLDEFNARDALLFVEDDFRNIAGCKLYRTLCSMMTDDILSQLILALHLSFTGIPINIIYNKIIDTNNKSCNSLGVAPVLNHHTDKYIQTLLVGAENGDYDSLYELGLCYEKGEGISQDWQKAADCYKMAEECGNPRAQFALGLCYYIGKGVGQNFKEAFSLFFKAAKQGLAEAQYYVGKCYYESQGVERNSDRYNRLAERAKRYEREGLLIPYFDEFMEKPNPIALIDSHLSWYDYFERYDEMNEQAVNWYTMAAKQGNPDALYALGECYYWARGVNGNHKKALSCFFKAAVRGHVKAQLKIGDMFFNSRRNEFIERSIIGFMWYEIAAFNGDAKAQYMLGQCYKDGEGVELNNKEAIIWLSKAAENGDENARQMLDLEYLDKHYATDEFKEAVTVYMGANNKRQRDYKGNFRIHVVSEINVGNEILHPRFGRGKVTMIDTSGKDDKIDVLFDDGQMRKLLLKFAKFEIL